MMGEKRTHHRDMEKRFLHPALQNNELFTVMVHKKQEALARDVMSAYPWFNPKVVAEVSHVTDKRIDGLLIRVYHVTGPS